MSASLIRPELLALRGAIDGIDEALGSLLVCRVVLSHQAQRIKADAGLPILDPGREAQILHRYDQHWRGAAAVARAILTLCREG